ncbi:hypothetical protein JCM19046_4379 [Bacillus sp. JCM 19046]|nr:hypothetical protein JCM19045_2588 [Bacillus sp. JCM 19045]GAF19710.1 hypothetical protein JCM19046_4379 [Bacillus sp. JCM 19046]
MSSIVRAEEVGAKVVEWYSCIIARSVDQAGASADGNQTTPRENGTKRPDPCVLFARGVPIQHDDLPINK